MKKNTKKIIQYTAIVGILILFVAISIHKQVIHENFHNNKTDCIMFYNREFSINPGSVIVEFDDIVYGKINHKILDGWLILKQNKMYILDIDAFIHNGEITGDERIIINLLTEDGTQSEWTNNVQRDHALVSNSTILLNEYKGIQLKYYSSVDQNISIRASICEQ